MALQCSPTSTAPLNPCLILRDGSFLSILGGEIIRMPEQYDGCCYGFIDSWLLLVKSDGGCSLVNPFSKATVDLPKIVMDMEPFNKYSTCSRCRYKLVVSSPLDSSLDSPVTMMFSDDAGHTTVGVCQPPIAFDFYRVKFLDTFYELVDVTFFDGKFYGLHFGGKLLTFEVSYGLGSKTKISSVTNIINSMDNIPDLPKSKPLPEKAYMADRYLVVCSGRLLMVRRWVVIARRLEHSRTASFEVFEADLSTEPNQWRNVQNLGGQALFVGRRCSKSFPAGEGNGIQEDCIYFMSDYFPSNYPANSGDCGVYNITDGMITPLWSETATVPHYRPGQWSLTCFFPADSV